MENTEIMNEAVNDVVKDVVMDEVAAKANNMNLVVKGSLVIAGGAALAWLAKTIYDAVKSKKELRQPDKEIIVEAEDVEMVAAE